jgi:hypothetical protein
MIWNRKGLPHKGWRTLDVSDLREGKGRGVGLYATCEMCGRKGIRYVHQMTHPEHETPLSVGRFCAAKMVGDYVVTSKKRGRTATEAFIKEVRETLSDR